MVNGQSYLVKNDGSKIEFKKLKLKEGFVQVTIPKSKEKLEIRLEEVKSYYSLYDNAVYYLKPSIDYSNSVGFKFMERIEEGEIKVYKEVVTYSSSNQYGISLSNQYGTTISSSTYLMLEKDNDYFNVFTTNAIGQNKKEKLEKFKDLVSDDSISTQLLNATSYKHKYNPIIKIVKEYNLRAHHPTENNSNEAANAIFFRTNKRSREEKDVLKFYVGKSEHSLLAFDKLSILIPADSEIKACVTNASENNCNLILGSKYFDNFYEIVMNKSGAASIEKRDIEYAEYHLNIIDHYIKKRSKK